jgi:hypothetical protein
MLRILGKISIFGTEAAVQQIAAIAPIKNSVLQQVGTARLEPDADFWCYGSSWYSFRPDSLDDEIFNFLVEHERLGDALATVSAGVKYAVLTMCPVGQSEEENFACLYSVDTLRKLSNLGLAMEIAPASVMPDVNYWLNEDD